MALLILKIGSSKAMTMKPTRAPTTKISAGARSEINVFVDKDGEVHVTGGPVQQKVVAIL